MAGRDPPAGRPGHAEHLVGLDRVHGKRLLDISVGPGRQNLLGQVGVRVRGRGDVHHVRTSLGEHGGDVVEDPRHAETLARLPGQVAVPVAHGHQAGSRNPAHLAQVSVGDLTAPDDGDAKRLVLVHTCSTR